MIIGTWHTTRLLSVYRVIMWNQFSKKIQYLEKSHFCENKIMVMTSRFDASWMVANWFWCHHIFLLISVLLWHKVKKDSNFSFLSHSDINWKEKQTHFVSLLSCFTLTWTEKGLIVFPFLFHSDLSRRRTQLFSFLSFSLLPKLKKDSFFILFSTLT